MQKQLKYPSNKEVWIGDYFKVSNDLPFFLIAGPCQIESEKYALQLADELKYITDRLGIKYVFKSSFDKANRTSVTSSRGFNEFMPHYEKKDDGSFEKTKELDYNKLKKECIDKGLISKEDKDYIAEAKVRAHEGCKVFLKIKEKYNIPIITDVHESYQANIIKDSVDIIQIPAFLSRQTDLVLSAAETQKTVALKKGQFLSPNEMQFEVAKVNAYGNDKVMIVERGSSFGYNRLVVDITGLEVMKRNTGCPIVIDATHGVQNSGTVHGVSSGNREHVPYIARAGISAKIAGLFLEVTHRTNDTRPDHLRSSDADNMIKIGDVEELLKECLAIDRALKKY